jgi:hypothetical protein
LARGRYRALPSVSDDPPACAVLGSSDVVVL